MVARGVRPALVVALGFAPACLDADDVLSGAPCPCATGYTCCEPLNVCVAPGESCPGSSAPSDLALTSVDPIEGPRAGGTPLTVEGRGFTVGLEYDR